MTTAERRRPTMKILTEDAIEEVATRLSQIYDYRFYLGPLPSDGHRRDARWVLGLEGKPHQHRDRESIEEHNRSLKNPSEEKS